MFSFSATQIWHTALITSASGPSTGARAGVREEGCRSFRVDERLNRSTDLDVGLSIMSVVGTTFSNGSAQQIILGQIIGRVTAGRYGLTSEDEATSEQEYIEPASRLERREKVTQLAQQLTRPPVSQLNTAKDLSPEQSDRSLSRASTITLADTKLFEYEQGSDLDPFSSTFDARRWTKSLAKLGNEEAPTRIAGISYRNMSVHGYGSDAGGIDFANGARRWSTLRWQTTNGRY